MFVRGARGPLLLAISLGLSAPLPVTAQGLSTFDDFSSNRIDGSRWRGFTYTVPFRTGDPDPDSSNNTVENPLQRHPRLSTVNATSRRAVVGGQLRLQLESAGGTHPDAGVTPGEG